MELTFVNKKYFKSVECSKNIFPTKFDKPNNPTRADIKLYFWPFYSGIIQHIIYIMNRNGWEGGWRELVKLIYKCFETKWNAMLIKMKLRRPTSYS